MMNQRRPKRSELAPQTLAKVREMSAKSVNEAYMKAMVTVMVYTGTYHACLLASPSWVAIMAWTPLRVGTIQKDIP